MEYVISLFPPSHKEDQCPGSDSGGGVSAERADSEVVAARSSTSPGLRREGKVVAERLGVPVIFQRLPNIIAFRNHPRIPRHPNHPRFVSPFSSPAHSLPLLTVNDSRARCRRRRCRCHSLLESSVARVMQPALAPRSHKAAQVSGNETLVPIFLMRSRAHDIISDYSYLHNPLA